MKRKHLLLILLLALGVPIAAWAQNTLVPYSEDFESYTNASIGGDVPPTGWTITKGANTVCEVVPVGSGKQLRIGSNGVSSTTPRTVTAKLPTFTSAAKYLKITLKLKANHTQGSALAIGYNDRTGAFNALQTFALNDYQTITTVTVDFNRPNVSNSIVIQYQGITANALWFIDDVQVEFRTKTPNNLAASDVTGSSAHLSWSLLGNAESYQVQYADNASFSNAQTATASNTSVTLSNLSCVTEYYARVRSVYGSATNNNLTYSEWSNVVSFTTSCATPTDVQVMSDLGETTVTWTGNAPSYHIQYKNVESIFGLPKQITYFPDPFTTNPSYTFDGSKAEPLVEGCKYQLRINAQCNPETSSEWSEWIDFQTACPGSLALPLHEHFDYHYGLTSNTENNLPSCWNYFNTTTDGNCMYYPLVEKNQSLCHSSYPNSGQYNYVRFHIDVNSTDKQEQYLILPAIDVNSLPDDGAELGFYLRPAENASAMYLVGLMSSPNDPNTFESLDNYWQSSTEYLPHSYTFTKAQMQQFGSHIAIVAVPHETATISFCIDDIDIYPANYICYIPGAVHTTEVTPNSAQITWMPGGTESLWGLQYKKSTDSEWTAVYDPGLSSTNCTLTDLEPNTTYNVRVRSWCNTVDYSDWNSELTFTTLGLVPTPGNFSLDATATGSSYVKILWSVPEPITGQNAVAGYEMQISEDGVNWENVPYGIARNEGYAVFDLIEPRTHYVRVRAQDNQENYGPWSEPFSFTISPCSEPTSLPVGETVSYNPLVSSATPHLPDCWTISDPNDKLTLYTSTNTLGFDGRSTGVAYAIMPAFNATTACDYTVSFEWMHVNTIEHNTNAGVSVQYSLDGSQWRYAPSGNIYVYDENIDHNFQFMTKSIDIPAHSQTVYVRFEFQGATEGTGHICEMRNVAITAVDVCPVPTDVAAINLTQITADISWTGSEDVESYFVKWHRTAQVVGINEQFNTSSIPDRWERKTGWLSDVMNGGSYSDNYDYSNWNCGTCNGVFDSHAYVNNYGTRSKEWLITPKLILNSDDICSFDLALTASNGSNVPAPATTGTDDRFVVLITLDNCQTWTILREWNNNQGSQYVYNDIACSATGQNVWINLSEYANENVRIAFYVESTESNADNNLHIDNVKIGTQYAQGGEYQQQMEATTLTITGLDAGTEYEVQVRSACSDPEQWSEPITFRTLDAYTKVFIGGQASNNGIPAELAGDQWSNGNNWVPYGMPYADNDGPVQDVIIRHNVVISDAITGRDVIANANSITFEGNPKPTLTLKEGSQLLLNTNIDEQNQVTVKKNITGYTPGAKDRYYLLSIPTQKLGTLNAAISGLVTTESDYDLYRWDYTGGNDGLEWRNYEKESFSLEQAKGYLYANAANVELNFTGEVRNNKNDYTIYISDYSPNDDYSFNGWTLCGNPFTCDAYLSTNSQTMAFYRMNAAGTDFELATGAIKPMEGFFAQNTVDDESVVLSRTAPANRMESLNIVLSQGRSTEDNAIIRFDEGNTLEKLSFREGSSKVYMPVEGKDYAVVNAGQVGELPLSFKAEKNGTYTLSFSNENVEFGYLHLIDNLTGAETNLLATPSYTFEARTTDYASRFRLVFASASEDANGDSETFAFNNNGNWIILNEGRATLQVIDLNGRILSSEQIEGSVQTSIHQPAGLYLIRLVNGDEVKVQKVVVR